MPGRPHMELGEGFVRSEELLLELRRDIDNAYAALELNRDSQSLRRCVVRAIFSFIEAAVECLKWEMRSTMRMSRLMDFLSEKDQETLGSLHIVGARNDRFLPLDQNIKRTFRVAAKIWDLKSFRLNTDGEEFQDFLRAKLARNRLTHPKTFYDIEVTDYDMHCHTVAGRWVQTELQRLIETRIHKFTESLPSDDRKVLFSEILGRSKPLEHESKGEVQDVQ